MNKRQKMVQQQFLDDEKAVIGQLQSIYGQSLDDINDKIKGLTFSIGKLQEEYDWMDPDDPERAKVKSKIQSKIYQKQYQEQLQKQVDGILKQMQTKQYTTVSSYLDECYEDGFVGSIFDLHGQGVPLITPINQEAMVRAVQLDSKISKGLYRRLGEDVDVLKKKITAQVSRSISTGMSYEQTAQALANYTRIGYNNAIRIARTEGHRIQCQSAMDAMESAKDRGADILKQWDATLDAKTRESHVAVDMEIRELDKPFSNGLMFPGDPSGGASEVINCRCSLDQRARWALEDDDQSFTKFNGFTGQVEEFESPETYGDFKKAFFSPENRKYMNYVQEMEQKYGTRDFPRILGSMSERDYKHFTKLTNNNPIFNKYAKANGSVDVVVDKTIGVDNLFVMVDDPPPMLREFTNVVDYRKAMDEYARKHPEIDPREFYVEDSNWFGVRGEGSMENVRHFDGTIRHLQDEFPLPPDSDKLFVGTFDGVEHRLTDIQRSRMGDDAAAQLWLNPDTNTTVIGFRPEQCTGTFLEDLTKRQKAIDDGDVLEMILGQSPEGTAIHEWGHAMSEYLTDGMVHNDPTSMEYWDWYKSLPKEDISKGLSRYATTNRDEFEAECFAELLTGNPRPIARRYGEYLERVSGGKISFGKVLTNSSSGGIIQADNATVRKWYLDEVAKIHESIDPTLPIGERARLAYEKRNAIKVQARNMMADQDTRRMLDVERPVPTFEELIARKMEKGMTREEAIQDIFRTATKTDENVNKLFGLGGG